jgi:hypothetical protein
MSIISVHLDGNFEIVAVGLVFVAAAVVVVVVVVFVAAVVVVELVDWVMEAFRTFVVVEWSFGMFHLHLELAESMMSHDTSHMSCHPIEPIECGDLSFHRLSQVFVRI